MISRIAAGIVAATLAACAGPSVSDVCEHACSCEASCTSDKESACETERNGEATVADAVGCTDAWDAWLSCAAKQGCGMVQSACADQQASLITCEGGTPPDATTSSSGGGSPPSTGAAGGR